MAAPKLAAGTGAELADFHAIASADGATVLATGCVATPIPGWVEDMRPALEARTNALAGSMAERITGSPVDGRADAEGRLLLRSANDLGGGVVGSARTFLGFDEGRVLTCFATCAARHVARDASAVGCARAVATARLEGSASAPRPGIALRAASWAVHHPRETAIGGGGLVVATALLAVVTRRRPRHAAK